MEPQTPRRLVILRGLPGSGKSHLARELLAEAIANGTSTNGAVLATDEFFYNQATGNYEWNVNSLPRAHLWNQLRAVRLMESGATPLLIDNTNLQAWEAGPYVRAASEHGYAVEIREPQTAWARDAAECAKRGAHGLREDAVARVAGRREEYSVKDALRAAAHDEPALDEKERKKVEAMVDRHLAAKAAAATATAAATGAAASASAGASAGAEAVRATVRIEISRNDGRKERPKPLVVKGSATLADVARLAANSLKLRLGPRGARFFTVRGDEIRAVAELAPGMQVVVSDNGQDYVPIALRKTAAERRVERAERALQAATEEEEAEEAEAEAEAGDEGKEAGKGAKKAEAAAAKALQGALRGMGRLTLGATEVSPRVFVGSGRDAHTLSELQRCGITHVLNCAADFPSTRISTVAAVRQLALADTEEAPLGPHLALAFEFLDSALTRPDARVLVHCAAGKSRSVAIAVAYLVGRLRVPLRAALAQVRAVRPQAAPNAGFMRQLMRLERRELGAASVGWEELASAASVLDWLNAKSLGGAAARATHMWCEANSKLTFRIPAARTDELLGEVARACALGSSPVYLIEMPDPAGARLHADVDLVFAAAPSASLEAFAAFFVAALAAPLAAEFPGACLDATVTGHSAARAFPSRPDVAWKLGLHLIWPGVTVTRPRHIAVLRALVAHLAHLEASGGFPPAFPLAEVRAHNEWSAVIDVDQPETGLRALYSGKRMACRVCAHKVEGKRAKEQKPIASCAYCHGTGLLPMRPHAFLGVLRADGSAKPLDLAPEATPLGRMQRLQLASILAPHADEEPAAPPATPVHYTAAVLDLADQARLLAALPPPPSWQPHATHMTLCLGPITSAVGCALGDRLSLTVAAVGKAEGVWAVRVSAPPNVACLHSATPHVTVAVAPGALPADANLIKTWSYELPPALAAAPLLATVQHCTASLRNAPTPDAAPHVARPATATAPALVPRPFLPPPGLSAASLTRLLPHRTPADRVLPLIAFLRAQGEAALTSGGQVKAVRHGTHRQLVQLSYGQASADFSDPVIRDCRGIIVDVKDGFRVVALPYAKFFNAGEARAPELDWPTARVYEKADGSLALLYHYAGEWHVASSSSPDGSGMVLRTHSFAALFWEIWRASGYALPTDTRVTFMFELLSPRFYPLIPPKREALLLHGARDRETLEELVAEEVASVHGWECVPAYAFPSLAAVIAAARALDVTQREGFVAVDGLCQRVKIKSPSYVALTLLRGVSGGGAEAVGTAHMLEIVRNNEGGEFLVAFPEYAALHRSVQSKYDAFLGRLSAKAQEEEEEEGDSSDEADGENLEAAIASEYRASGAASLREFLAALPLERLHRLLDLGGTVRDVAKPKKAAAVAPAGARGAKASKVERKKERRAKSKAGEF